jgi:hypothetical protein
MIDDAAWVTYPLHLAVGIVKTFLFFLLLIGVVMLYTGEWMFTSHDERAELIKDFPTQETVYRVDLATGATTVAKQGYLVDKDTFAVNFNGCEGTDSQLKHATWFDRNWLAGKSDEFQATYIMASRNIAALRTTLGRVKRHREVNSFHYACMDAVIDGQDITIPNAPVVNIGFLERTDQERYNPASGLNNWFVGMCLSNCTDKDFMPRNDSIYADALYHEVTPNQEAALKALHATGTPEFWIVAAHANGIYDKDALIAGYAKQNKAQLENDLLRHIRPPEEEFLHEMEISGLGCLTFIGVVGVWILRRRST